MTEIINDLDMQRALKYYNAVKKASQKYCDSDKGKERRRVASANYYQKKKELDPDFMKRQCDKAKKRYHLKKSMTDLLPDIEN